MALSFALSVALSVAALSVAAASSPSQVLVVGPHHSGTSIVSRALAAFGLHLGDEGDLLLLAANPNKFWERRDIVDVDRQRLEGGTPAAARQQAAAAAIPPFVGYGFDPSLGAPLNHSAAAHAAHGRLEALGRPWATKDPRMSLVAGEWLAMLEADAACILTLRHPLEFASSMLAYAPRLGLAGWTRVWLHYTVSALRGCERQPLAVVDHRSLTRTPTAALAALHARLAALGLPLAPSLNAAALAASLALGPPPPSPRWLAAEVALVAPEAIELYEALAAAAARPPDAPPRLAHTLGRLPHSSWPPLPPPVDEAAAATSSASASPSSAAHATTGPTEAYATLLTTADPAYLAGALALGSSIRAFDAADASAPAPRDMVALVTAEVPLAWHRQLARVGWTVRPTASLEEFWWGRHPRCTHYAPDQGERWGKMATKLRVFELTRYERVVYLDADAVLLASPAPLFAAGAPVSGFAAEAIARKPSGTTPHAPFNAGVLSLAPSLATLQSLLERAKRPPPSIYHNVVDCTEQALLNDHFDGSTPARTAGRIEVRHPAVAQSVEAAKAVKAEEAEEAEMAVEAAVAHWITTRCPKPWDYLPAGDTGGGSAADAGEGGGAALTEAEILDGSLGGGMGDGARLPAECDSALYAYWWRVYARTDSDALAEADHDGKAEGEGVGGGGHRARLRAGWVRAGWARRLGEYDGCSVGCPDEWIDDGACDAACNNVACSFDKRDCFHDAGECYTQPDGSDYRGKISATASGRPCQAWSAQSPNHHTMTLINYPTSGLGGHSFCRNPDGDTAPWCYTLDYPNVRREHCDVGRPAAHCDPTHPSHAMPGGAAAPIEPRTQTAAPLILGKFVDGHAGELELVHYQLALPRSMMGVKVVLVPVNGDCDLFVSFDHPKPTRLDAAFIEESIGVKQWTLSAASPHYCGGARSAAGGCTLYLSVSGFEDGSFKLAVYNYTAEGASISSAAWSCSEGCDELRLGNTVCDRACNVSACVWDQGDCGYSGGYQLEAICSTGCARSWQGDGYCDEACFNAACDWDEGDCIAADHGCADGCLPSWIDDEECDELCNNEACGWDGSDCSHNVDGCYTDPNGTDYRGSLAATVSGRTCQAWSRQQPHAHLHTHLAYPHGGLGGHNYCRNPGKAMPVPWCHTTDPAVSMEACAVPPPQRACVRDAADAASDATQRYRLMCPVDCAAVVGNGVCEPRCNISSCAYDAGDCGVGVDLLAILADQGIVAHTESWYETYTYELLGAGLVAGVSIGLAVLRLTILRMRREETKRRGYSQDEQKGMDNCIAGHGLEPWSYRRLPSPTNIRVPAATDDPGEDDDG